MYRFERTQIVPRRRAEVFAFFSDAANLEALTPTFLKFKIETPLPIEMRAGALIEYRLKLYGVPVHWQTRIESYEPERQFVDTQLKGPYKVWHHTHTFVELPGGRTEIGDAVNYALPLAPFSAIAHPFVKRALRQIFDYRQKVVAERFGE